MIDLPQSASPKLRVLHVVLSLDVGGLERIVVDLLREGRALGQTVGVLCLERAGDLAPQAREIGAQVLCANKRPGITPALSKRLAPVLREFAPTVVHTHQITPLFYAGPAAKRAGVPLVVHTEHGKNYQRRVRTRVLGRIASRHAHRFFCVSDDIAGEVIDCGVAPDTKVSVVPNGIDPVRFARRDQRDVIRRALDIPADAVVVGTVGRLSDVKRQDLLISAFAIARRTDPRMRLIIVGDGARGADLHALAEQLNLAAFVHFVGYQPHPEKYLQAMDVFALTSRSEGMPLAVLEAWASGLAVVGSRVGGIPELIEHQYNGLLFESGDERALAMALATLSRDRALSARLGEAGRRAVRSTYHIRSTARNYHDQYTRALSRLGITSSAAALV